MKSLSSKILLIAGLTFLALQFFRPDTSIPEYDHSKDFLRVHKPPQEISNIIKSACYDCHSYQTSYPWYSGIVPISWWLQDHIEEGREEFNLSLWADYSAERADHKIEEAIELVEDEEMPLPSYTWVHSDARLSDQERRELSEWFTTLREEL